MFTVDEKQQYNNNVIGKKNNQTSVSGADREISTLRSTDNARNTVNLVSGIIRVPSGWDFSVCIGDRWQILFVLADLYAEKLLVAVKSTKVT